MKLEKIIQKVRKLVNTSQSVLDDNRIIDLINESYLEIQTELANEGIDVFGAIRYTDLIANQEFYGLPQDALAILRLEVNYDDPSDENKWKKVDETDLPNIPYEWFRLLKSQPRSRPLMDLFAGGFTIFPRPTETKTAGLRIWYIPKQPDFTSPNDDIPYQIDKYWRVLAFGAAYNYLEEIGHPLAQRRFEIYRLYLGKMIEDLKTEVVEPIKTSVPNYFNSGWL